MEKVSNSRQRNNRGQQTGCDVDSKLVGSKKPASLTNLDYFRPNKYEAALWVKKGFYSILRAKLATQGAETNNIIHIMMFNGF